MGGADIAEVFSRTPLGHASSLPNAEPGTALGVVARGGALLRLSTGGLYPVPDWEHGHGPPGRATGSMGDKAYIPSAVDCDFCQQEGKKVEAAYDGATQFGPWAYMCDLHFMLFGRGLGTGRGQRLIVGDPPSRHEGNQPPTRTH